jgi:hypothetical protein
MIAGVLFVAVPNWARAQLAYGRAVERHVAILGADASAVDRIVGWLLAWAQTALATFGAGVVDHPILTVLLGVGFFLAGIVVIVEYGILATDTEPWRGEFEM